MKQRPTYIYSILQVSIFVLSMLINMYDFLSILLSIIVLVSILDKLGKGIVLRELMSFHACILCLIMPLIGYTWYGYDNYMARLWVKYMAVPKDIYFSFALPAISGFITILCLPFYKKGLTDSTSYLAPFMNRAKFILQKNKKIGLYIMLMGLFSTLIAPFTPEALRYFVSLFYFGSFAGFLYVYYCPAFRYKKTVLILFTTIVAASALQTGLFTVVAYMGITMFSFIFLGRRITLGRKLLLFTICVLFLVILQFTKIAYRKSTWANNFEGNKTTLFLTMFVENIQSPSKLLDPTLFFPIYVRANQGFNVSLVMNQFPRIKKFDNGQNLLLSLQAAFVPRILWPDKPKAGGEYNMAYYTGIKLRGLWSTNVGPLGEAYGSFGVTGGIIYMILLGALIRFAYSKVFKISRSIPFLLFWIPLLFYQITYSMETDTLQILNSLVKSSIFIWLLYKAKPEWFGIYKRKIRRVINSQIIE